MTNLLHYEDFTVGRVFPLGPYNVTADEIIAFAEEFDPQPQHLSEEGGKASILGGLAASGFHVCGMAMRMLVDGVFHNSNIKGGIGADDIRWLKPVRPGDTLHGRIEVGEVRISRRKPEMGFVQTTATLTNQHGEVVFLLRSAAIFKTRMTAGQG